MPEADLFVSLSSSPLVSVVIPAYAAAAYIRQTLDSVFRQTYANYEVIVVNDGSPDREQLESALNEYGERVIYIKQENRGPSGARNAAIRRARGEFIAFLDSDDLWFENYLESQLHGLEETPGYDFIYCDAKLMGDGVPSGRTFMQAFPSRGPVNFESLLSLQCIVISSCTVARRESIVKAGLFDEGFRHCEDFDLWLRIAFSGARMRYQPDVLACHRVRQGSLSACAQSMRKGRTDVYRKIAATLPLRDDQRRTATNVLRGLDAVIQWESGKQLLLEGKYSEAVSQLRLANEHFGSGKIRALILLLRVMPAPARWIYHAYSARLNSRRVASGGPEDHNQLLNATADITGTPKL
jgi:glycosyltransferase involved in cell wall biosynthesis